MPFINVKTNAAVPYEKETAIKSALGQAITAIPGKSESWLMVGIEPEHILYFKEDSAPAAMVEVSVFGHADSSAYEKLTDSVCTILNEQLSIDPSRIYVKYSETPNRGWNGSNF
ncbi:phenylpyruvate tautomerase MIF-related protein [Ruminococcus sp.]|uniref:phenylpyruvate tautomerase MIF-related protein n=1 Tax=Ruminococcus sp. TaxID=41978 RepID=UPI002E792CD8|nr:phenylpyruvate tautomerase MIF-related protein [Ruminococcus sp.]MEE0023293.1 phenylpyruvate tautomerase MIF-related protein [Ruminococcus sp.]